MYNFIDKCLNGDALPEEIDDYIDTWHKGGTGMELHHFLGMTEEEYQAWLFEPDILAFIITGRRNKVHFTKLMSTEFTAMAARSQDISQLDYLQKWLKKQGHIK